MAKTRAAEQTRRDEITVDLYPRLPKGGYKPIVVRAEPGLFRAEGKALKPGRFTSEGYRRSKYVREQLNEICEGQPTISP